VDAQSHRLDLHGTFRALPPTDGFPGRGGQGLDQLFDCIQRSRTRLARLTTPTVDGGLGGGRGNLIGQTTAKGALHGTYIGHLAIVEPLQKIRIVSISCIDHHRLDGHAPLLRAIQHPQCDLGFGLLADLLWYPRLLAPLGILGPGFRQKQLGTHREVKWRRDGRVIGEIFGTHHYLAIADFAECPRVLRSHAD
jgi:hypothetical protein